MGEPQRGYNQHHADSNKEIYIYFIVHFRECIKFIAIFAMYSGETRIQDIWKCSIASESPPRKMNEHNITNVESMRIGVDYSHSL